MISPVFDGWVSVFPNLNGQDDKVSKAIAKRLGADTYAMAHDDSNQRLIFAGLGGEIRFLDLQSGQEGSLLEVPGSPAILDMRRSFDNSALCCVCQPSLLEDRHKKPAILSVWNYDKLNAANAGRQT